LDAPDFPGGARFRIGSAVVADVDFACGLLHSAGERAFASVDGYLRRIGDQQPDQLPLHGVDHQTPLLSEAIESLEYAIDGRAAIREVPVVHRALLRERCAVWVELRIGLRFGGMDGGERGLV